MQAWWSVEKAKVADEVIALVKAIRDNYDHHYNDLIKAHRLYGNFEARGLSAGNYAKPKLGRTNYLTINVIKSCVDTIFSKIAKSVPRPTFLTNGGSWEQQKKARQLEKFVGGIFYQTKFIRIARLAFRDAEIFGKGVVKFTEDARSRIKIERVFPDEIVVDPMEAVYGEPRQMHQIRVVSKDVLLGMFKDNADAKKIIEEAKPSTLGVENPRQSETANLIQVVESWHLPSAPPPDVEDEEDLEGDALEKKLMEGHDGRHSISIDGGTLLFEAWREDFFPFAFIEWDPAVIGFWPKGLPHLLRGMQYEINRILRKVQDSIDWCVPKAFVESSSKVVLAHLNDIAGGVIRFTGTKPTIEALQTISPQLLEQVDRLIRQAYEMSGVSQLSAQSRKPAGLTSGKSLRDFHDIETERFAIPAIGLEDFVVDSAVQVIRLARKIAKRDGDYGVTAPLRRRSMKKIKWSEINLEDPDFVTEIFPTSVLPTQPAGRMEMVQDWLNLNLIDTDDIPRLLNFPDLQAVSDFNEAAAEYTHMQIEAMIEKGKAEMPQPYQNLNYAKKLAQNAYLAARTMDDVPEENLHLLENYMQQCVALMQAAMPPAPPSVIPPPPPGAGAPPPPPQ